MPDELTTTTTETAAATPALSAAPAAEAPAAPVVSSQETEAAPQPVATSESIQQGANFAEALRAEMQTYMSAEQPQQQTAEQTQQPEQPEQNQEDGEQPPKGFSQAGPDYESPWFRDTDGREVIPAVYVDELQREVTVEELVDKFKGFEYYHQNALKAQQDIQRINAANQQLAVQRQELQQKMDELNAAKNDPTLKILQMLKGDEDLKRKFTELVRRERPHGFRNIEGRTRQEQQRAELESLQNRLKQLEAAEQQRVEAVQKQQRFQNAMNVKDQIEKYVAGRVGELKNKGINVTDEDLKAIAESYLPMAGVSGFNFDAITRHFNNYFNLLESKGQQFISDYQQQKRAVAPAPPSGGAAPVVTPTPIRGREDFEQTFAARFTQLVNGL